MTAASYMSNISRLGQSHTGIRATPMASSDSKNENSDSSSKSSASITANDFLTLLVTEMKNQDPTANTNPNEYINQLVNVNSLQQLVSINETLTDAFGTSNTSTGSNQTRAAAATEGAQAKAATATDQPTLQTTKRNSTAEIPTEQSAAANTPKNMYTYLTNLAHGNLSIPEASPAADRLSHALSGRAGVLPTAR